MNEIPPLQDGDVFQAPAVYDSAHDEAAQPPVAIVTGSQVSFASQTAELLHSRLLSVSYLLLAVYVVILVWVMLLIGESPGIEGWVRL